MSASWNRSVEYCPWKNEAHYVSISNSQRKGMPNLNYAGTVYNGLEIEKFEFKKKQGDYLAFLGRYSHEKGADLAVTVAAESREKLKMAGTVWGGGFYDEKIKPYLKKNKREDLGFLNGKKVSDFLGNAKALLFPIRWEEPFGLVMIEAMACGTPVIAFNKGSAPEIVKHEKTGFIVENEREMIKAIKKIDKIDRADCRKYVEENFTIDKMVEGYERIYEEIINQKI